MDRKLFYAQLDKYAEVWYLHTSKLTFEEQLRSGNSRALRCRNVTTEIMHKTIAANDNNLTGYPIIERWRHPDNSEVISLYKIGK